MPFTITPEQDMLRDSVRSFLGDKAPMTRVREVMETETGYDPELWAEMAGLGLPAMHIPEEYGGAGFSYLDLGIVLEELGRALTPSPMFSSIVLGANLLLLAGSEEQKQAHLPELAAVRVPQANRLAGGGSAVQSRLYDLAAVGLAFEQVGGAQRCMEMAVAYAKDRMQFGRPIGSFQAIKHKCADMLVAVESAKSAAYHAGWAATADADELRIAAPLAKSYCSESYFRIAGDSIQVHGGIGFTWEHDAHLYFKRAKSSQLMLGDPASWRAALADRLDV